MSAIHPFKRTFTLVQHTPLIHFQYDQTGATLRATEVKPKLDRFLIKHHFKDKADVYKPYLMSVPNDGDLALDYKMHIKAEGASYEKIPHNDRDVPMFFANMGDEYKLRPKGFGYYKKVELEIFCLNEDLLKAIEQDISLFFAVENFGMRSTKGYGGFTVTNSGKVEQPTPSSVMDLLRLYPETQLEFTLKAKDVLTAMTSIGWFYKLLRSGINIPSRKSEFVKNGKNIVQHRQSRVYCKPVIFYFAKAEGEQWDKRSIKEKLFKRNFKKSNIYKTDHNGRRNHDYENVEALIDNDDDLSGNSIKVKESGLIEQENYYAFEADSALHQQSQLENNRLLYRDLFGLSSEQEWGSYGATLLKEHQAKSDHQYERIPSPVTIKIFNEGPHYRVFVLAKEFETDVLNASFKVWDKNREKQTLTLSFPKAFTWKRFFDFLKDKEQFSLAQAFMVGQNQLEYSILKGIVDQIQKPSTNA